MELVNKKGTINALNFKCLKTDFNYRIIGSKSTHTGSFFQDSVWKSKDLIIRSDGIKKIYTREELKKRFNNVQA